MQSNMMEMAKNSDDSDHLIIPGHHFSIGDPCVTNAGCHKGACSHISAMQMAKSSDDIDHLTTPDHCLSIGDECEM